MKCPFCSTSEGRVIDSRPLDNSTVIRRRRECVICRRRFTTYERAETMALMVVKSDQRRELFDRQKLQKGIMHACMKRPISIDTIESVVAGIERELENYIIEIPSFRIGEMVLEKLRVIDEVAYVRFASVYRKFDNVDSFMKELQKLKHENTRKKKVIGQ